MAEGTALQARSCDSKNRRRSFSGIDSQSRVWCASDSNTNDKQLSSLSSYFGKLKDDNKSLNTSESSVQSSTNQLSSKKRLEILDAYLDKLDKDADLEEDSANIVEPTTSSSFDEDSVKDSAVSEPFFISKESERGKEAKTTSNMNQRSQNSPKSSQMLQQDDETSDLYLISILASINIAVILFEIASPVRNSELELSSLPLLYGAKVNHMILVGEWWRLVTPMFLHYGFFHIALSCWVLLTFGPKVCKGYGSFTFVLIYILGGISGNLISFLHTPDPTVGGTGPVYAIIGAWLIYQNQNKDVIAKDVSDSMYQKAIIATGLGLILSHFCPIDDWSHFGATFTGVAYGLLTCPTLQLGDAASRTGQEEGLTLVKRQADPCKSLFLFGVFIVILSSLFFIVEPPLNDVVAKSFL
ncbi:Rhomboid protease gluP [Morus notabilis]|uniref:Rhomboid protease gluP n=2 Tax=Morus notabilis TaxID=981085 RepID=W9SBA5_9ROSA|nr:Rhomboid protease gluP [Morus notabilis]